jgi:hypothetical protein
MKRLTKSQVLRRLQEASSKLTKIYLMGDGVLSLNDYDKLMTVINKAIKKNRAR